MKVSFVDVDPVPEEYGGEEFDGLRLVAFTFRGYRARASDPTFPYWTIETLDGQPLPKRLAGRWLSPSDVKRIVREVT